MINFHCPEFFYGLTFYDRLFSCYRQHPEIFLKDRIVKKLYGSIPGMTWNSGCTNYGSVQPQEICRVADYYNFSNIPIKLTLTNLLITKEDCYDRYCNMILEIFHNDLNEVLVASPILQEYIEKKYPKYKINRSILATEQDNVNYLTLADSYNTVVLPRRLCKDFTFLSTIPKNKRSCFELLCNDPCPLNCPNLYTHYKSISKQNLYMPLNPNELDCISFNMDDSCIREFKYIDEQITPEEIDNYNDLGFTEFKISGRPNLVHVIPYVINYLIKPEYKIFMTSYFLDTCGKYTSN